jgi:protein O-GlcNAc transferase
MPSPPNPVQDLLALHAAGRFAEMEAGARALMRSNGSTPILNELLGIALCAQQRFAEALPALQKAAKRAPNDPQFLENLALCQRQLGDLPGAERSLRRSLELRPRAVEALNALASVLRSMGRPDEAEAMLRRALALAPQSAVLHVNLANALVDAGRAAEAEASFRQATALDPRDPTPLANLAILLADLGRYDEARASALALIERIGPITAQSPAIVRDLADAAAAALTRAGDVGLAAKTFRATGSFRTSASRLLAAYSAARRACDWPLAEEIEATRRAAGSALWPSEPAAPLPLLMMADATAEEQLVCARRYAEQFRAAPIAIPAPSAPEGRVRIGYLSNDFCDHATTHLIVGVLECHDRDRFEIIGYDYTPPGEDAYRRRVQSAFDRLVPVGALSNRAAAERIAADRCDIVVDLKGWTAGTRSPILAARPAPVQVQWLGYPGTLGATWIDYIVADRVVIEAGEETHFSEKVIRLPGSYQCNDDRRQIAPPRTRRDCGLPDDAFVFCSFNQPYKIVPELFAVWMRLLASVDGSVLWLLDQNPDATAALRSRAVAAGIAADRLVFAPWAGSAEHLARAGCADLALDCYPYGSHTTASDMLWAGIPLVALKGQSFVSRASASILAAAGLPDLVATSLESYFDLAMRVATDAGALARLKARVAKSRRAALFDTRGFARHLEAAYLAILERHRRGLAPDHLTVEPA